MTVDDVSLYVVDSATGEVLEREASREELWERVVELEGLLRDAERDLRGKRTRIRFLEAQLQDDRVEYDRKDEVQSIFDEWRTVCRHPKSRLTPDRFDAIRGLLEVTKPQPYPREAFSAAIAGAAFDPYTRVRKNGTVQIFDDVEMVMRSGKSFEEFCKRAPKTG